MRPRVLTIGAYERDNFGDVLFSILTRTYLDRAEVVAGSVLPSVMPDGTQVGRYVDLLESESWDAIWVVGGEIGGVRVDDALQMSMERPQREEFVGLAEAERMLRVRELTGLDRGSPAYLPRLSAFPRNATTSVIVNSVGISALEILGDDELSAIFDKSLASACAVRVRDPLSLAYSGAHGFSARLGPDMVHAIPLVEGFTPEELSPPRDTPYVLFQLNSELGASYRLTAIADELAAVSIATDADVVLFAAGTTFSHDDLGQYGALAVLLSSRLSRRRVVILRERDPRGLVRYIAAATLWIGSSLHGRIVACAYGVPRVSLQNDKVSRYVATWDPSAPAGIVPDELLAAVEAAVQGGPAATEAGKELSALAHANTKSLAEMIE